MAGRQLINPGPIEGDLLNQQNIHRSQFVWDGTGNDDHLRLSSNFKTYWDYIEANPLPQRIHDAVREAGFMGVLLTGSMRHDAGLISAFLDRWRPETHTFHLRFGEATVTLEDVYYILGLRSVGRPVLPIGGDVGASLLHELLGVALDPEQDMDVIKKGEIKITPMQRNVYLMQHPRALRWMVPLNATTVQTHSLRGIRYDLDTMSEDSFRWRP
ncbi:hypothetical protein AgCh_006186 [Apium graveolens]